MRFRTLLWVLVLVLGLASCASGGGVALEQPSATEPPAEPTAEPTGGGTGGQPGTGEPICPLPGEPPPSAPPPPGVSCDPPPEPSTAGAQPATPRPGTVDPRPVQFQTTEAQGGGSTLRVFYYQGVEPCSVLDRVEVKEADDRVTVTVMVGADPQALTAICIEIAELRYVDVPLSAPLGTRTVVDGAL